MAQAISVPEDVYERLQDAAVATRRPLEEVAAKALLAGLPPTVSDAPEPLKSELSQLNRLNDDALWGIWHSRVPKASRERHIALLEKRGGKKLTALERKELTALRSAADRLLLIRAHAAALLRWRGHGVPLGD